MRQRSCHRQEMGKTLVLVGPEDGRGGAVGQRNHPQPIRLVVRPSAEMIGSCRETEKLVLPSVLLIEVTTNRR
jgi:hypothetical protein